MSTVITYTIDCGNCGGEATCSTLDLSNPQPDGSFRIDVELTACQAEFTCQDCGATVYTGDLDTMTEGGNEDDTDPGEDDEVAS